MITLKNISKKYQNKLVLNQLSLDIPASGITCITGESGAGKTTLLNIISLIEKPSAGDVIFDGLANPYSSAKKLRSLRRTFGYIFQNYGLVDDDSVRKNLDLSTKFSNIPRSKQKKAYIAALTEVGLNGDDLSKKIHTLSGGEQQRVALARIILTKPKYIFADEPTGNLDEKNRNIVFRLLKGFSVQGIPVIIVSHDPFFIHQADNIIKLGK